MYLPLTLFAVGLLSCCLPRVVVRLPYTGWLIVLLINGVRVGAGWRSVAFFMISLGGRLLVVPLIFSTPRELETVVEVHQCVHAVGSKTPRSHGRLPHRTHPTPSLVLLISLALPLRRIATRFFSRRTSF